MINIFGDEIVFEGQRMARITAKAGTARDRFEYYLINAMSPDDVASAAANDLDEAEAQGFELGKNRVLDDVLNLIESKRARKHAKLSDDDATFEVLQAVSEHLAKIYGEG